MKHKGVRIPVSFLDGSNEDCDRVLVCLPQSAIPVLVSLSERLLWGSTWVDGQRRRVELTDSQAATIDDIIGGLLSPMCIDDMMAKLEEIMTVTVNNNVYCGSCGSTGEITLYCVDQDGNPQITPIPIGDGDPTVVPLPPGLTEPPVIDPGIGEPPVGWDTWEAYDEDACRAANAIVEYLYQVCRRYEELMTDDIPNAAAWFVLIVNFVTSGGLTVLFNSQLLYNIASFTATVQAILDVPAQIFGVFGDTVQTNRANWVCYLYNRRGSVGSWETALIGKLFEAAASSLANETERGALYTLFQMLLPAGVSLSQLYSVVTYSGTFSGHDCSLCQEEDVTPPVGYTWYYPVLSELTLADGTHQDFYPLGVGGVIAEGLSPSEGGGTGVITVETEAINTRESGNGVVAVEWAVSVYPNAEFGYPTPSGGMGWGSIDVPSKTLYTSNISAGSLFDEMRATYGYIRQTAAVDYIPASRAWNRQVNVPANTNLALDVRVRVLVEDGA